LSAVLYGNKISKFGLHVGLLDILLILIGALTIVICAASAGKSKTARTITAITVPVASVVLALGLFCIFLAVRKPTKKSESKFMVLNLDLPSYVIKHSLRI